MNLIPVNIIQQIDGKKVTSRGEIDADRIIFLAELPDNAGTEIKLDGMEFGVLQVQETREELTARI